MHIKKTNAKGFTLIELLIVIIIIGILAAIAFVAYSGSQNKAHKADAQSTLAEVKNKLAEYNADNGNYPVDIAAVDTWLASPEGGKNTSLSQKFTTANSYSYTPGPTGCDNGTGGACSTYSLTADKSIWSGDTDITVTN
jgi:type IV pilus assembly protein PilE